MYRDHVGTMQIVYVQRPCSYHAKCRYVNFPVVSGHHVCVYVLICKESRYDVQVSKSNVHVRSRYHEGVRMRGTTQGADDVSEVMTRHEVLGTIQLTIVTVSSRTVKHGLHGHAQCVGSASCVCLQRHPNYT